MEFFEEIMRAERQRTMNYGADVTEVSEMQCPVCGSTDWDFLMRDCHGDFVGCQECVSKIYFSELV